MPKKYYDDLRCSLCSGYLSVLPVYYCPASKNAVCGRCNEFITDEDNPIVVHLLEDFVKKISFPCRWPTCQVYLSVESSLNHEKYCDHKPILCPQISTCNWEGKISEIYNHFLKNHKENTVKNLKFIIDVKKLQEEDNETNIIENNYLVEENGFFFVLVTKFEIRSQKMWFSLHYLSNNKDCDYIFYQIQCKLGDDMVTTELKQINDCNFSVNKDLAVDIPFSGYLNINNVEFKILLNKQSSMVPTNEPDPRNGNLLEQLDCPVCKEFMVSPIYQCKIGHSICATCKTTIDNCPICRTDFGETRNFALENLTKFVIYPCKYSVYDCPFVSGPEEIKEHEKECLLGIYKCPLNNCNWKGKISDIMAHANNLHEDNIFEEVFLNSDERAIIFDENTHFEEEFLTCIGNRDIFKIEYKYQNKKFYWWITYIGLSAECEKLFFELQFSDEDKRECNYFRRRCNSMNETNSEENALIFGLETVGSYVKENMLKYKLSIITFA